MHAALAFLDADPLPLGAAVWRLHSAGYWRARSAAALAARKQEVGDGLLQQRQ